jgi:hypothetical protein
VVPSIQSLVSASSCCVISRCNRSLLIARPRSRTAYTGGFIASAVRTVRDLLTLRDFGNEAEIEEKTNAQERLREWFMGKREADRLYQLWLEQRRNNELSQGSLQWLKYFSIDGVIVLFTMRLRHSESLASAGLQLPLVLVLKNIPPIIAKLEERKGQTRQKRNGDRNNSKPSDRRFRKRKSCCRAYRTGRSAGIGMLRMQPPYRLKRTRWVYMFGRISISKQCGEKLGF